jgi:hypothetical protein
MRTPRSPRCRAGAPVAECGKALGASGRVRAPCRSRVTRSAALIGALRAISIFVRAHAASRFDRCLVCTAKPYV